MSQLQRVLRYAGVGVAVALLFVAVGQASSGIAPLMVLRTEGITYGDYHGGACLLYTSPSPRD